MNDEFNGITATSYQCQSCGKTGKHPKEIEHAPDCTRMDAVKREQIMQIVRNALNSYRANRNSNHGMIESPLSGPYGDEFIAREVLEKLEAAGRLK